MDTTATTHKLTVATGALALVGLGVAAVAVLAAAPSPRGLLSAALHGTRSHAAAAAVTAVESTEPAVDPDHSLILALVNAHRRGASDAWCARLAEAIYRESTVAEIDPLMVASIVARESSFKSRVVSHAGAVGLMQLRPFVAKDVARRGQVEWNGVETLHSPDTNVRLGILYYKELVDRFDGDHQVALTAYNQGPTRVSRNLRRGTYVGSSYADEILGLYASIRNRDEASKS